MLRNFFTIALLILLVFVQPVNAYIDMGTGSYVFQVAIAFILSAGVTLKIYWQKIKSFFTKKKKEKDDADEE